jgi:hypothetical protein
VSPSMCFCNIVPQLSRQSRALRVSAFRVCHSSLITAVHS